MKKKKVLLVLLAVIVVFLGLLITLPVFFKDDIKKAIDEQLAANVNADVLYDLDNFSVSLLPNFPNLTVGFKQLGVVNRAPFEGDILFAVENFEVEVNLWDILFGDKLSIEGIYLDKPQIFIKVLADGTANYDIAIAGEEEEPATGESTDNFSIAIKNWQINDGKFVYDDATLATYLALDHLNHRGSGDFSLSIFDMDTYTEALITDIVYEGDHYLTGRHATIDMVLNMDLDQMKFTFRENKVKINDFAFGFDGWLAMPAEDIDMDISFASRDNSFKSLLSLVPALYASDFDKLEASGTVAFQGQVKGTYNDTTMPAYEVGLQVKNGEFGYPDLPQKIKEVNIDMQIACADGNIDNTRIAIPAFHALFGSEPFDGYLKVDNLVNYPVDMRLTTTLNLANLSKLFPMEDLTMAGIFKADIKAKGVYDSVQALIPTIAASMSLYNGRVEYAEVPAPLEDINFAAQINNTTGRLNDTEARIPAFGFTLAGSPVTGSLLAEEFDDLRWEAAMEGNLDFDKLFPVINKLYPLPGTTLGGKISTRFKSEGRMSDLDQERYERLTTSGKMVFDNFTYTDSAYLPQGMTISKGDFSFNPRQISVTGLAMQVGKSDFSINGLLTNYLKYALYDNETIQGSLRVNSQLVDLNEWMTTETTEEETAEEETTYEVIPVPKNIDFTMQANMARILYDNLELLDARGAVIVRDGVLYLSKLATRTLGGTIVFDGNYDTRQPDKPTFDMVLDVNEVDIDQAYTAFNTVQMLAPLAGQIKGKVSTIFKINGTLQPDMMPDMSTLNGSGKLLISQAELGDERLINALSQFIKGTPAGNLKLTDMAMQVAIVNGRLRVDPFDVKIDKYLTTVAGSSGLDGSLDYSLNMTVPAGKVGSQVNNLLGNLTGTANNSEDIKLNLKLAGNYKQPVIKLLGADAGEVAKKAAVTQATKLLGGDQKMADSLASTDVNKVVEEQKKIAEAELKKQQDSLKKVAEQEAEKAKQKALEEAGNQLKNLFGPKKKKKNN